MLQRGVWQLSQGAPNAPSNLSDLKMLTDQAYRWMETHAVQRLQLLNFFWLSMAFLTTGYVAAMARGLHFIGAGVGVLGVAVSYSFVMLEKRAARLIKLGQDAILPLERRLAEACGVPELKIMEELRKDPKSTHYFFLIPKVEAAAGLLYAAGATYALIFGIMSNNIT